MWSITGDSEAAWPEEYAQDFDTAQDAWSALKQLRTMGFNDLQILRDGQEISEAELVADIDGDDIRSDFDAHNVMPAGYRRRHRGQPELGISRDGMRGVWKPENPEDHFE